MKLKLALLLSLPFLLLCSWEKKSKVYINGFNREAWIKDSTGCLGLRARLGLCDTLFCNREKLLGLSDKEIIEFLGKPNRSYLSKSLVHGEVTSFYYYVVGGPQCDKGYKKDNRSLDIMTMCVLMSKGKVFEIVIASGGARCK